MEVICALNWYRRQLLQVDNPASSQCFLIRYPVDVFKGGSHFLFCAIAIAIGCFNHGVMPKPRVISPLLPIINTDGPVIGIQEVGGIAIPTQDGTFNHRRIDFDDCGCNASIDLVGPGACHHRLTADQDVITKPPLHLLPTYQVIVATPASQGSSTDQYVIPVTSIGITGILDHIVSGAAIYNRMTICGDDVICIPGVNGLYLFNTRPLSIAKRSEISSRTAICKANDSRRDARSSCVEVVDPLINPPLANCCSVFDNGKWVS